MLTNRCPLRERMLEGVAALASIARRGDFMQTAAEMPKKPANVMLIEDDADMSEALSDVLLTAGYYVDQCADGRKALAHLQAGAVPDVILLDLIMPELNGWEFRVAQKQHPDWATIPVIVYSGDCSAEGLAIDADRVLHKPMRPETLLDSVASLLLARDRARLDARALEFDRMSSLGVLSAGLAHEINNPLAVVMGNLELGLLKFDRLAQTLDSPHASEIRKLLENAQAGAGRISNIVRRVALFASADAEQTCAMDIHEVLIMRNSNST